jgi:hypothetical protein
MVCRQVEGRTPSHHPLAAGPSGKTKDYPSDEIQPWRSLLLHKSPHPFGQFKKRDADKLTLHGHSIGGDDDVIE